MWPDGEQSPLPSSYPAGWGSFHRASLWVESRAPQVRWSWAHTAYLGLLFLLISSHWASTSLCPSFPAFVEWGIGMPTPSSGRAHSENSINVSEHAQSCSGSTQAVWNPGTQP